MRQPIQFWQFLLTIFAMLVSFGLYLNGITDRQSRTEVTVHAQQKEIDELKANNIQMKASIDDVKFNVSDMRGDIKVLLSKME